MERVLHNVLGAKYLVKIGSNNVIGLEEEYNGGCNIYRKEILIGTDKYNQMTDEELEVRIRETVAHEIFHAYVNEAGLGLDLATEERMSHFFMKNWRKMNNSILEVLDRTGFLDT